MLPTPEQTDRRLRQILAADSAQTGAETARLMLMLTRSCELRCAYCFVALSEEGYGVPNAGPGEGLPRGDMPIETVRRAIDLLVSSDKPRLGLQLFGGEPTRRPDLVRAAVAHAAGHPGLRGRTIEILLTTNGLGDVSALGDLPVTFQLSVDGVGPGNRFRRPHLLDADAAARRWEATFGALRDRRWFLNVTLPPSAGGEVADRVAQAARLGVPALQINYATGMNWSREQAEAYLAGLRDVLLRDARRGPMRLYNWHNAADPAPLCGDLLCDVDGTLLQVGGVFHEKRFPALRAAYRAGHLDDDTPFDARRHTLADLWARTRAALSPEDALVFLGGMRLGAAQDLVCRWASATVATRPGPARGA